MAKLLLAFLTAALFALPTLAGAGEKLRPFDCGENETVFRQVLRLAEGGDADAQYALSQMYHRGEGATQDLEQAVGWAQRAAENGQIFAMKYLHFAYFNGRGVDKDDALSLRWLRQVAERDRMYADFFVDVVISGELGEPDYSDLANWIAVHNVDGSPATSPKVEALIGNMVSVAGDDDLKRFLFALARVYSDGVTTLQDVVAAHVFFALGASLGDQSAARERDRIAGLMTPEELRQARSAARPMHARLSSMRAENASAKKSKKDTAVSPSSSDATEDLYDRAVRHFNDKEFGEAHITIRKYTSQPSNEWRMPEAYVLLGRTLLAQRRDREAARILQEAYEEFGNKPAAADLMLQLGRALRAMGQENQSCAAFREVSRHYPDATAILNVSLQQQWCELACGSRPIETLQWIANE